MNESVTPSDSGNGNGNGEALASPGDASPPEALGLGPRLIVLAVAFFGWLFAGTQMSITTLAMRPAVKDLLVVPSGANSEAQVGLWFSLCVCAFLLGAALGGLVFGWVGDRLGRAKAMAYSIMTYSAFSGLTYFVETPTQLVLLRFVTCMGIGGMWPNGVALVAEAWSNLSRPVVAGIIGTAANVGIVGLAWVATAIKIDASEWRWVVLVGASPLVLGVFALLCVPESPSWLATRSQKDQEDEEHEEDAADQEQNTDTPPLRKGEVFRMPLLPLTMIGILLGTVPLMGGWGSANWVMAWAGQVGDAMVPPDPHLKADLQLARSVTSVVGSLLGGMLASALGRRLTYFLVSLGSLLISQLQFWFLSPADPSFLWLFGIWGFFNGVYFGWLPLCLPEMFPTRVRATGAGVSFNWGRILTAGAVLASGFLLGAFGGYAALGRVTSLVFLLGMVVIMWAPDTSQRHMAEEPRPSPTPETETEPETETATESDDRD